MDKPDQPSLFPDNFINQCEKKAELSDSGSDSDGYEAKREARELLRAFMQVENESTMIKDKVTNRKDWKYGLRGSTNEGLYDLSKWDRLDQKVSTYLYYH